ncbi:MAG: serine/threonine protein kinase [Prevotella sp.]|nr:serine/threonine protein kinase [Prevotella sp.]
MIDIEQLAASAQLFDNRYLLVKSLSTEGGSADVWLALDWDTVKNKEDKKRVLIMDDEQLSQMGLLVAIKTYRPKNALDDEGRERFRDEFTIVYNCNHANLIHPTHFSIFEDIPYLVLPYCPQESSEKMAGYMVESKDVWKYVEDVASGLAYLHSCEPPIIHLDIKPANVLLDEHGNYAITDFGISTQYTDDDKDDQEKRFSGTAAYMAPERFDLAFEPSKESDIWAFGATIYELVMGKPPFGEEGGYAQSEGKVKLAYRKGVAADVQRVIAACLDYDPAKRPTAEELAKMAKEKRSSTKWVKIAAASLSAALALMVIGMGIYYFNKKEELPEAQPTDKELFTKAMVWVNANNADSLKYGLKQLENLAQKKTPYVPALYELGRTYGWMDDSIALSRKRLLNIEMNKDHPSLPLNLDINLKAMNYFTSLANSDVPGFEQMHMEAAYLMAKYYSRKAIVPNMPKSDQIHLIKKYLQITLGDANKINNTEMVRMCENKLDSLKSGKWKRKNEK